MSDIEDKIGAVMAKIRAAVARAPSHEEVFAAFEAMLRHMSGADQPDMPAVASPANDETPVKSTASASPPAAAQTAGDKT